MLTAGLVYATVGVVAYVLLGPRTQCYPNVLTAFGDDPLVAAGSAAIAFVNFVKLPLMVLPLRALLLEQLGLAPLRRLAPHAAFTLAIVGLLGGSAAWLTNLAFAFQLSGSTAGVMVCFILPGLMHFGALRNERLDALADLAPAELLRLSTGARAWIPRSAAEAAGLGMAAVGAVSGAVCLWVLFRDGEQGSLTGTGGGCLVAGPR
eukprot:gene7637-6260_t